MGIPWLLALKAIPWDTILANAPAILRSADALRSETKVRPPAAASRNDIQALADRVAVLEQRDRETAELLTRVSAQVAALTTAGEVPRHGPVGCSWWPSQRQRCLFSRAESHCSRVRCSTLLVNIRPVNTGERRQLCD